MEISFCCSQRKLEALLCYQFFFYRYFKDINTFFMFYIFMKLLTTFSIQSNLDIYIYNHYRYTDQRIAEFLERRSPARNILPNTLNKS